MKSRKEKAWMQSKT